ncbi:hypothetical protein BST97_07030 [Nonlabens spongiae]|uniref:Glycosyl transferase family 1 domain-containing protein n=1 Tax=Nonlabens spongiae TaxID=331648 RepID=A0A1W6MJI8_9FLAO|nr:glycosyltransferase [Nonlabens spongiae]ARN77771.1 hypothetical protein BST97_07030 [Nonlabens spongiae]
MKVRKVIWLGPVVNSHLFTQKAVSPAANKWQSSFIHGLLDNKIEVINLSYQPCPLWPRGALWIHSHKKVVFGEGFKQLSTGYLNVPFIREYWISASLFFKTVISADLRSSSTIFFTYNPLKRHLYFAKMIKLFFKLKWISVVADDQRKGNPDIDLYLSHGYFRDSDFRSKLFLDGGIEQLDIDCMQPIDRKSNNFKVVYSGAINDWTGIFQLVEDFNKIDAPCVNLEIYGKGEEDRMLSLIESKSIKNVVYKGFVSDSVLMTAMRGADVLINPRNTSLENTKYNFPSKLLTYIALKKPVISTFSAGLSPSIRAVLLEYTDAESLKLHISNLQNSGFYKEQVDKVYKYKKLNSWRIKVKALIQKIQVND